MRPCLVLTRPRPSSEDFARAALAAGWRGDIVIAPLMEIALVPPPVALLDQARALIFTSQHGVRALEQATAARHWPVWAVGPRTAEAAIEAGFAQVHQAGGDATALLAALSDAPDQGPFLHLRGAHVAADIVGGLRGQGTVAEGVVVYTQRTLAFDADAAARITRDGALVLPVFSPRSGAILRDELVKLDRGAGAQLYLVAISPAAATATHPLDLRHTEIAPTPDADGMLAALAQVQAILEPLEKPS